MSLALPGETVSGSESVAEETGAPDGAAAANQSLADGTVAKKVTLFSISVA